MSPFSNFVEILRRRAIEQADHEAYILLSGRGEALGSLTYSAFDERARTIAAWLQARCSPGDRVLLLYPPGLDYICGFFGCLYAGVIAVPAYPPARSKTNRNTERLYAVAADAGAVCCLTNNMSLDAVSAAFADWSVVQPLHCVATDQLENGLAASWHEREVSPNDLAFFQYTSGSTGDPKGVMVRHGNLIDNSQLLYERWAHSSSSRFVSWLPPYHDMGLIGCILQSLYGGFPNVLMAPIHFVQRPWLWLHAISRYRATTSGAPDFAFAQCARQITPAQCEGLDLSSWKVAFNGSEPIRRRTLEQFIERFAPYGFEPRAFYPCYGLAEATLFVTGSSADGLYRAMTVDADELALDRVVEVEPGHPRALDLTSSGSTDQSGHPVLVVDPDTSLPVAERMVGEVWVGGPSVAGGYWRKPEATRETFDARLAGGEGPFLRTGDLGFVNDGELFVNGRIKDVIIVRGRKHHPQDIEITVAQSDPEHVYGLIAAFTVEELGEPQLVLLCEVELIDSAGAAATMVKASRAVSQTHGLTIERMVFVRLRSLPKTSSGKLQRRTCREHYLRSALKEMAAIGRPQPPPARDADSSPRMALFGRRKARLRQWLIGAVADLKQLDEALVDPSASFFELGLDSAEIIRLSGLLEAEVGRMVEPALLFDHSTVDKLVAYFHDDAPVSASFPSDRVPAPREETVGVVGLSCRFPGAPDPRSFWVLLERGIDAITEVPASRWNVNAFYDPEPGRPGRMVTRWGGFIDDVERFDAEFFNISPREALRADPQQRLLLELAWEALQDAGIPSKALAESRTGVFLGISTNDYAQLQGGVNELDAYSATGTSHSIAANRISYYFDFRGPSVALDTACSSSLVALHMACRSLLDGECDVALVGGVNLMLGPEWHIVFSHARMMAADGRCKAFDDEADGYVRGEGAAFVVLKRTSDALNGQDRLWATIRATAVNQDGRSNGITAPNGRSQEDVIRRALAKAALEPQSVDYVEAHGTGTKLGDPIEYRALESVYAVAARAKPLLIGSVKSNIGHLEAAAGMAGLIKVLLSLHHGVIPAHLHFRRLNRHIPSPSLVVCDVSTQWPRTGSARIAGISSFGFGGTNCHVLVEEPPLPEAAVSSSPRAIPSLLTLSAASDYSLRQLSARFAGHVETLTQPDVENVCYTTNVGRDHLTHRFAVIAHDGASLAAKLRRFADGEANTGYHGVVSRATPKLVFTFTGQGSQVPAMGRSLFERIPIFRQAMERCNALLASLLPTPLLSMLYGDPESQAAIDRTEFAQPAIAAFEYSLAQVWLSWGLRPVAVLGHSLGEYVAACIAGALPLEDTLRLVAQRGRLMQSVSHEGLMVAVHASEATLRPMLDPGRVSVAAVNGPKLVVISGPGNEVKDIMRELKRRGIASSPLRGDQAFHSADVEAIADRFEQIAAGIQHTRPSIPLISNLTGAEIASANQLNGRYWRDHMRQTVQFERGIQCAIRAGANVFLEIGPDETLSGIGKHCDSARSAGFFSSLQRGKDECESLSRALAGIYAAGVEVDWRPLHAGSSRRRVSLPTYVFQKKRFWPTSVQPLRQHERPIVNEGVSVSKYPTGNERMPQEPIQPDAPHSTRALVPELRSMLASLLGLTVEAVDVDAPFLEMGADSLILMAAIQGVGDKYNVHLSVSQLFEEASTIRSLASFIAARTAVPSAAIDAGGEGAVQPGNPFSPDAARLRPERAVGSKPAADNPVTDLLKRQLALMSEQLQLLTGSRTDTAAEARQSSLETDVTGSLTAALPHGAAEPPTPFAWAHVTVAEKAPQSFTAWARPPVAATEESNAARQSYLNTLTRRQIERTPTSKRLAQSFRPVLADNRASAGFRQSTKEMLYPIVGKRAAGSRTWDVDGNEYLDFTMGFGANLFGHSPDFIMEAIRRQLSDGFQIGPQSELAGLVAQKIAAMTGQDRVAFCNSGSEAVMTAVRLARAVTKRTRIALFTGSYHGTFDGVLARARVSGGRLQTVPAAEGTPASFVEREVLVLEYGDEASLRILQAHARELAAVIVEPVQSRFPDRQPKEFLVALRALTQGASIALVWDETITGFRAAPGGAQEYFGIQADIATYGKVIGGGMPIGVVAGRARFMDALDGGVWSYGDDSYPRTETIFFAGTFNKHPLTMSAALAVLDKLERSGPELHRELNGRTTSLARTLNDYFLEEELPLRIEHFSSLFRFAFTGNMDVLFYGLLARGIYIWEGRNCFLSTAHDDADIASFIRAVKDTVEEMRAGGYFPARAQARGLEPANRATGEMPLNAAQERFAHFARAENQDAAICNIPFSLKLTGPLDLPHLEEAFNDVIGRHEALRASFDLARGMQHFAADASLQIEILDFDAVAGAEKTYAVERWKQADAARRFDVAAAPLVRVTILKLGEREHILHVTVHHLVCDGVSLAIVLLEVSRFYTAHRSGIRLSLAPALSLSEYEHRAGREASLAKRQAEAHWHERLAHSSGSALPTRVPSDRQDNASKGGRVHIAVDRTVYDALVSFARARKCTPFMVLFAAFEVLLFERLGSERFAVAVSAANRSTRAEEVLVGNFVALLPIACRIAPGTGFGRLLDEVKLELLSAYRHAQFPCHFPPEASAAYATFNMEPRALPLSFGDLEAELTSSPVAHVEFGVMMNVTEAPAFVAVDLDFRERVLDAAEARRWLDHYEEILKRISTHADDWTLASRLVAFASA
ncbi:MAG TPA: aminotransferase class III-fold pyridoxal phosphate-dependent enzyme [Steroidobacteraceae bacterium]|nr:aminotransferase class III-fold pyridoxal phosphate-dependent enzyme [Steroidobacteraceae bacterium]